MTTPASSTGRSILQDWVTALPIRYQGTLLAALRGCDGVPKNDVSKTIARGIRSVTLNPADDRELKHKGGYMSFELEELIPAIHQFGKNMDHYPLHFVTHVLHAIEVIGYQHPTLTVSAKFTTAYKYLVRKLHLRPEPPMDLHDRMTEDRIANGTV
jgi:hypothetical protein